MILVNLVSAVLANMQQGVAKMVDKQLIGRESSPVQVKVETDVLRRFCQAAGIPFDGRVPPTFFGTIIKGKIEGIDIFQHGAIHGEQKFSYFQPVFPGDHIVLTRRITDIFERSGSRGKMSFVIIETRGRNQIGEHVLTMSSTVIFPDEGN